MQLLHSWKVPWLLKEKIETTFLSCRLPKHTTPLNTGSDCFASFMSFPLYFSRPAGVAGMTDSKYPPVNAASACSSRQKSQRDEPPPSENLGRARSTLSV